MESARIIPPHPVFIRRLLSLLLTCLILLPLVARSQISLPPLDPESYPLPADMSRVHFYLVTVDVGDHVWDNFGHTALRVLDENSNSDTVFNWGYFDTSGGIVRFGWNFFKGIMNYRLVTNAPGQEFAAYRQQERTVWQDKINLSNAQKEILYRRLLWNMEPENIVYPYQYFFDNCTTRVRDYLDEALGGQIASQFEAQTDTTFRESVRAHYESVQLIRFSLDILMNSNIDRPMTGWEAMYRPIGLRQGLATLNSQVAEDGQRQRLLSDHQVIMEFAPPAAEVDAYRVASLTLLAPALFLFLMIKKIPMSYFATHSRLGLKSAGFSFRLLGLLGLLTSAFAGVYGCMMLGSWFVSDHLDLHHNINLLLFWPTDLLGIIVALRWLFLCKAWPLTHNNGPFINYYMLAHVLAMLAYVAISVFDLSVQSVDMVALYVVPGYLVYTLLIWLVGFEPAKPRNMFF